MAIIRKKIENLKPGKDYVLVVRAKDNNLNIDSEFTETLRFRVPTDQTIPMSVTGLEISASYEKVMFSFNPAADPDVVKYEYEIYDTNNPAL